MNGRSEMKRTKKRKRIINRTVLIVLSVFLAVSLIALGLVYGLYDKINDSNAALKENNSKLSEETGTLKTRIAALENSIKTAEEDKAKLTEELAELQAKLDSVLKELEDLKSKPSQTTGTEGSDGTVKLAYLTFDDGVSENTPLILDILDRYSINATFFVNWKPDFKESYNLILKQGSAIGNHSYSHEWKSVYSSLDGFVAEVNDLQDNLYEQTGYLPTIFRFPGGSNNTVHKSYNDEIMPLALKKIIDMNFVYFDWNVDSGDADGKKYTADEIAEHVLTQSKNKKRVIVLMHDVKSKKTTVEALPQIIEGLRDMGFTFEVLSADVKPIQFAKP